MRQPFEQQRQGQVANARRGQLDGQRQPVQPTANRAQQGCLLRFRPELGVRRTCALDEQGDGFAVQHLLLACARRGQAQRRHAQLVLARDPQGDAAGGQHPHAGRGAQHLGDPRRAAQHLLQVVQHQHQLPVA